MHFICRPFIGKNDQSLWSQYWENEPDDDQKFTKGHLFGLINIKNQQSEPITIGRDIIFEINQLYFTQESEDINLCLKNSLTLLSQNPIFLNYQIDVSLMVVFNKQVYLATLGTNNCLLQRNNQISILINGQENQIISSCGPILENDRFLLASLNFLNVITLEKIKTILVETKIQNIEENVLSLINSTPDQNQVSAVLIECHQDEVTSPEILADTPILQDDPPPEVKPSNIVADNLNYSQKPDAIYVQHQPNFKASRRKKTQLIIAIVLIFCLSISIYYGNQKNKATKTEANYISLKTELEQKLTNINTIKGLDLEAAVKTAQEAKIIVDKMVSLNIHQPDVSQYKSQIDSLLFQTGSSEAIDPQVVQDTSFIVSQPQFSHLYFSNNNLFLLDSSKGRLDSLNPQNKSSQNIIISESIKSASHLLFNNSSMYLLKDNILSLVDKNNLQPKFDFSSTGVSLTITDVDFWNGSLYVLDSQTQSIWKLSPNSTGFSSPQKWLKNDTKLEIGTNSLAIDGQVWVLNHSGQIELYTSGVKDKFSQKTNINFTKTTSLKTDPESDFLIFSDNSEFIYVYRKNGEYYSKYNLSKFKVVDFAFDSANKIIYFLSSDQKIYQIPL